MMAIDIIGHEFEGPYTSTDKLQDRSGVYVVLCKRGDKWTIIDVGESAEVKTRIENHDRSDCWVKNCSSNLAVAVLYTPNKKQSGRKEIEGKIRERFNPPCGDR